MLTQFYHYSAIFLYSDDDLNVTSAEVNGESVTRPTTQLKPARLVVFTVLEADIT